MIDPIAVRNLFGIEGLNINWYGIIVCAGIIAGILVGKKIAREKGYNFDMIIDLMLIVLPLAIICARIYYVAFEWENYAGDFMKMIAIWEGGIAIYGGVIGALIGALIFCKWRKVPFGDILDIGAPGLILGQAIGRWGNFVNQEAFGNLITDKALQFFPYGVYIEADASWHQATFFYESMWDIGVMVLLLVYARRAKHDGNVFAMYLIGYGIGRFWIEGIRISTLQTGFGMPVSQFLSLILVIIGIVYILVMRKRNKPDVLYEGRYCKDFKKAEA